MVQEKTRNEENINENMVAELKSLFRKIKTLRI